ncbi:MAG: Co2+/Mg2+ efflux protein ApaG [Pseudomonadota bacterium]
MGRKNMTSGAYSKTTQGVRITVQPQYLDAQSSPDANHYVWAYRVEIENLGDVQVQLINRTWLITDSNGKTEVVKGPGVVGEQPVLQAGEAFSYTSGAPLSTPSGFMRGSYGMVWQDGHGFEAEIPAFSLDSPFAPKSVN